MRNIHSVRRWGPRLWQRYRRQQTPIWRRNTRQSATVCSHKWHCWRQVIELLLTGASNNEEKRSIRYQRASSGLWGSNWASAPTTVVNEDKRKLIFKFVAPDICSRIRHCKRLKTKCPYGPQSLSTSLYAYSFSQSFVWRPIQLLRLTFTFVDPRITTTEHCQLQQPCDGCYPRWWRSGTDIHTRDWLMSHFRNRYNDIEYTGILTALCWLANFCIYTAEPTVTCTWGQEMHIKIYGIQGPE